MKYTIFILTLVLSACSPKLTTNYVNQSYPMVSSFESFGSRCHQIKASVFKVDNPRDCKKIHWHPSRKLEVEDFKGATENRAFQAYTHSEIEYYIRPKLFKDEFHIKVHTQFNCFKSYFKKSESDSSVLAHEQLHFDITEIYARRLYKALLEANLDPDQLRNQLNKLLNDITIRLSLTQDKYDAEVYENPELQTKWNSWVTTELDKLKDYEQKEIKDHGGYNRNQIR